MKIVVILPAEVLVGIDGGFGTFQSSSCAQQQACVNNESSSITSVEHELVCQSSRKKALANSVDPDEMPHDAAKASEDKKDILFHFIGRLL
ncbi:hypothetical protein DPMN_029385 [Dreissena polymorpha]|uniref:Uncharacterized protein n=1 Tax=Dreissena polymorpha TaxID=45954 RepID=A0A9D4RG69_DREPO|nr:hypothetical protein DPMN_029385 [Dreissena polymorpha]